MAEELSTCDKLIGDSDKSIKVTRERLHEDIVKYGPPQANVDDLKSMTAPLALV